MCKILDQGEFKLVNPRFPQLKPMNIFVGSTPLEVQRMTGLMFLREVKEDRAIEDGADQQAPLAIDLGTPASAGAKGSNSLRAHNLLIPAAWHARKEAAAREAAAAACARGLGQPEERDAEPSGRGGLAELLPCYLYPSSLAVAYSMSLSLLLMVWQWFLSAFRSPARPLAFLSPDRPAPARCHRSSSPISWSARRKAKARDTGRRPQGGRGSRGSDTLKGQRDVRCIRQAGRGRGRRLCALARRHRRRQPPESSESAHPRRGAQRGGVRALPFGGYYGPPYSAPFNRPFPFFQADVCRLSVFGGLYF